VAIGFIASDNSVDVSAPGATQALVQPTGTLTGHIVIAVLTSKRASSLSPGTWTAPAGWTAVKANFSQNDGTSSSDLATFWANGSVASYTFTKSGTMDAMSGCTGTFSGADTTTPIDVVGASAGTAGATSILIPSITIATANAWHLIAAGDYSGNAFTATNFNVIGTAGVAAGTAGLLYNTTPKSTGSAGTVTLNDSAASLMEGFAFALRPAGAAGDVLAAQICL
jgi:hypothetical protein